MKGFVLAAGLGTRLKPITDSIPKPLVPVGNVPLVGYSLRLLSHFGITEVIVNTHHLMDELKAGLGTGEQFGVSIVYSEEEESEIRKIAEVFNIKKTLYERILIKIKSFFELILKKMKTKKLSEV